MGAMSPATALLASGIIGGTGSLAGGLLSSSSASKNNETALDFNRWSQLQSQQFQQQMYTQQKLDQEDFYKKYQSPQAIAKALQQLGVNPASAFSGSTGIGTSPASMPSVPSSAALSAPALENEGAAFSKSIEAIGNAMSSIVASGAQSEQSQEMLYTFNERMNSLILQNSGQQLMNAKAQWDLFAAQNKLPYEIQNMVLKAYADYYAGRHSEALAKLVDIQSYIEDETKDMTIEQRQQANTLLGKQILVATEDAKLRQEQQRTERSQQALNRSSAAYNTALTKTENALRSGKIELQNLSADLATINKYLSGNELNISDATKQAKIFGLVEQMYREGLISENVYKEGQILSTKRDWAARQEFGQYLNNVVGAASTAVNAYSNYRGVSVSRLNAQERNAIQDKFVDEYVRQSKQNSSAKRSAILGPDYEMYSDQFFGR